MSKFCCKLEVFEGPLDLLIHLIKKNKVSIYDIPISDITEQYLDYINQMEQMDLELSSDFLVMAAHLLYVKSRMLLPKSSDINEEDEDPRQELMTKLIEYKKYKEVSEVFSEKEKIHSKIYYKNSEEIELDDKFIQIEQLSIDSLKKAIEKVIVMNMRRTSPPVKSFDTIVNRVKISVKAMAKNILRLVSKKMKLCFSEILTKFNSRSQIVANFLALLELAKSNKIKINQENINGDIYIYNVKYGEVNEHK